MVIECISYWHHIANIYYYSTSIIYHVRAPIYKRKMSLIPSVRLLPRGAQEVHEGAVRHAALDALVAAVELGPRLLKEHHPELIGILT